MVGLVRGLAGSALLLGAGWTVPNGVAQDTLIAPGSIWKYRKGVSEASNPPAAWRQPEFADTAWAEGAMPFHYGYANLAGGTRLTDMRNGYTTVYLRHAFPVSEPSVFASLTLRAVVDDGFFAWLNGREVYRYNVHPGEPPYNAGTPIAVGATPVEVAAVLTLPPGGLRAGVNVLAVQAVNRSLTSSDFYLDLELRAARVPPGPPTIQSVTPVPDSTVGGLRQITVIFSKPVTGVEAADLLVNGQPATGLSAAPDGAGYDFFFAPPPPGRVEIGWNPAHGIRAVTGELFDATAPEASWTYRLAPPSIVGAFPVPGSALDTLTQITVTFSEAMTGVEAAALLINGRPADTVQPGAAPDTYHFHFTQPLPGPVAVVFDVHHTLTDLEGHRFDETAPGASWTYHLADRQPPTLRTVLPVPGAALESLSRIEVTFSEPVTGLRAADLRVNGQPARSVSGEADGPYLFEFDPPGPGPVTCAWAADQEIRDQAPTPNRFAGGDWDYQLDPQAAAADVVINEFLTDNLTGLRDEDGQKQDWIELWNRGSRAVNLLGWSLTNDPEAPGKWVFPALTLAPGQYLVIFASGKNRAPTAAGAGGHTNFRLNAGGGYLGLFNADLPRRPVHAWAPDYPEQRADVAYGLTPAGQPAYLTVPTPGRANAVSSAVTNLVAAPVASVQSGFFDAPFEVALSTSTPEAVIRYTTDGSTPTDQSPAYTGPLRVSGTPRRAAFLLRAAAFRPGWLSSPVITHTYLFPDHVLTQPADPEGFPTVWDSPCTVSGRNCQDIPADYEMDPEIVNRGDHAARIRAGLLALPTLSLVTDVDRLFGPAEGVYVRREDWNQQPVHAELLLPDGGRGFSTPAGLEIQGGTSPYDQGTTWKSKKLSLRLLFKGDFGARSLEYPVFPDSPVTRFNTLVLDHGLNYVWHYNGGVNTEDQRLRAQYVRDAFVSDLERAMGRPGVHWRFVHLYLNGLYWGISGVHERPDDKFAAAYFGGEPAEYDVLRHQPHNVVAGSNRAYLDLLALIRAGPPDAAAYEALQRHLDLPAFIDYLILNFWAGNTDWAHQNWYACRRRAPDGRWRFISWDAEHVLKSVSENRLTVTNAGGPTEIFQWLRGHPEFRLRFADHVHRHCFNGGVLAVDSPDPVSFARPEGNRPAALYLRRAREIEPALIGESARWGNSGTYGTDRSNNPLTYEGDWLPELWALLGLTNSPGHAASFNYFPRRTAVFLSQLREADLYPDVAAPVFEPHGGRLAAGQSLRLSAPEGTIYYTTNGADPRTYGSGVVSPGAREYIGPLRLEESARVRARTRRGEAWSALTEADFVVGPPGLPVRFTEIMYHPPEGSALEFLELHNHGPLPLNLSGYHFRGVNFVFPEGSVLAPGARLVLANDADPAAFARRYPGVWVAGYFGGNLSNGGERLELRDRQGIPVLAVEYDDEGGWPPQADGGGASLELADPDGDPHAPATWRASSVPGGTPGHAPSLTPPDPVAFSEVMADNRTTVPHQDTFPDWVELHNPDGAPVDLSGWSLSDNDQPRRYVLPAGTVLPAGGYLVIWCAPVRADARGLYSGFGLDRDGENLFLYDARTNLVDAVAFGRQFADHTLARVDGRWQAGVPTPGAPNAVAVLAPATRLCLNEWLINAPSDGAGWVELYNRSPDLPVALAGLHFEIAGRRIRFASRAFLEPGGFGRLWADERPGPDHLDFTLPAAGGTLVLYDTSGQEVDRVVCSPGTGDTSEGRLPDGGERVMHFPGTATPGRSNWHPERDSDGDGLLDLWEWTHGTDPLADDAGADSDGDEATNREEFLAGTDPLSPTSVLRLEVPASVGEGLALRFLARPGRAYAVQSCETLPTAEWETLHQEPPGTEERWITVPLVPPADERGRYFRLTVMPSP